MNDQEILDRIEGTPTPAFDPRWPNCNMTNRCYQEYVDYHRCVKKLTEKKKDTRLCGLFELNFKSFCPNSWAEKWDTQREDGVFPAKI